MIEETQGANLLPHNKQLQHVRNEIPISERIRMARRARHDSRQKSDRPLTEIRRKKVEQEAKEHEKGIKRIHTVGIEVYDALVKHNPKVKQSQAYRFALRYLLIDRDFVDKHGRLLIPDYKIAVWCGADGIRQYINGNFSGWAFIKKLTADVLPDLEVGGWRGPDKELDGQCRYIVNDGLYDLVEHALSDFNEQERYDLISMRRWNYANAKANRDRLLAEAETQQWPYEQQARIARYLHALSFGLFAKQIPDRIEEARTYVKHCPDMDGEEKRKQYRILRRIEDCPQPIYRPGQSMRNARLFAFDSLCDVERNVRRILCRGWHEVDFVSCYPAIAARIWHIERLQTMLERGIDVWNAIATELGVDESERRAKRDIFKRAGCRLLCDGRVDKTNEFLQEHGIPGTVQDSPTLIAIIQAVRRVKRQVRADGGTQTPLGWIDLPGLKDKPVRAHLSNVLAAYELALIAPCFEVAEQSTDFSITMAQHDGFSIKLRQEDRLKQVLDRLNEAVKPIAQQYGIITRLECKT